MVYTIYSQIEYEGIHSDLSVDVRTRVREDHREIFHEALDEWLDNSMGEGAFFVGDKNIFKAFNKLIFEQGSK